MSDPTKPEFSKLRASIWPIHTYELKKFLPMAAIMMLILFNYTVVRCLKDTLIISDKGSGAEVVNFLKAWIVFPASVIFVIILSRTRSLAPFT